MLEFISEVVKYNQSIFCISIHLMLKFILCRRRHKQPYRISKHLMLKFIDAGLTKIGEFESISKHLMLKFIRLTPRINQRQYEISKHPMLKFINTAACCCDSFTYFNTSHVKVYLHGVYYIGIRSAISIHPMLKFIRRCF